MNSTQWSLFFKMLRRIVKHVPGTWEEKMRQVIHNGRIQMSQPELSEFVGWNWPEDLTLYDTVTGRVEPLTSDTGDDYGT